MYTPHRTVGYTEGTHAAAPVLGRGPLSRVGLTTNQLEDRRWPTFAFSLHLGATRFWCSSTILAWLTQFVGCNNFGNGEKISKSYNWAKKSYNLAKKISKFGETPKNPTSGRKNPKNLAKKT